MNILYAEDEKSTQEFVKILFKKIENASNKQRECKHKSPTVRDKTIGVWTSVQLSFCLFRGTEVSTP